MLDNIWQLVATFWAYISYFTLKSVHGQYNCTVFVSMRHSAFLCNYLPIFTILLLKTYFHCPVYKCLFQYNALFLLSHRYSCEHQNKPDAHIFTGARCLFNVQISRTSTTLAQSGVLDKSRSLSLTDTHLHINNIFMLRFTLYNVTK